MCRDDHGALLDELLGGEPPEILAPGPAITAILESNEIFYQHSSEAADLAHRGTLRRAQAVVFAPATLPIAHIGPEPLKGRWMLSRVSYGLFKARLIALGVVADALMMAEASRRKGPAKVRS